MSDQDPQYRALSPHPANPPGSVRALLACARRGTQPGELRLRWRVQAPLARLAVPRAAARERRYGLWRHTCFEAFLREPGQRAYCELNFSPGGDWAAYAFEDVR